MLTLQAIYTRVRRHLLTQGERSQVWLPPPDNDSPGEYVCQYRTDSGLKCAIGCLIPDRVYHPRIEGIPISAHYLLSSGDWWGPLATTLTRAGIPASETSVALLLDLQRIHDKWPVERWECALDAIARRFNLDTTIQEEV